MYKGKGSDLGTEPPHIKLCLVSPPHPPCEDWWRLAHTQGLPTGFSGYTKWIISQFKRNTASKGNLIWRVHDLKIGKCCLNTGDTTCEGLYGKALPERNTFFRLWVFERVEIPWVELNEREFMYLKGIFTKIFWTDASYGCIILIKCRIKWRDDLNGGPTNRATFFLVYCMRSLVLKRIPCRK